MQTHVANYKAADILGRSQVDLILRVYDGALQSLAEARTSFIGKKSETSRTHLESARKCVTHLYTTLDFQKGGEISMRLASLYVFVISKLWEIESTKEVETLDSIVRILSNLRSGWAELKEQQGKKLEIPTHPFEVGEALTPEHPITV